MHESQYTECGMQVALLERFYLPTAGSVLLDGHDIGTYDRRWLRRRMAIVSRPASTVLLACLCASFVVGLTFEV